jgi:hypothetical protein
MISDSYFQKLKAHFNGDTDKVWLWLQERNPALGCVSPWEMIKSGRVEKLKKFIDSRLKGEFP